MNPTLVLFLYLATAPIQLMPSVIAALTKRPGRGWIIAVNVGVWLFGLLLAIGSSELSFAPHTIGLVAWLVLLAIAIRKPSADPVRSADEPSSVA